MHQYGWLSERGGNFKICFRKKGVPQKGGPSSLEKGGGSNPGGNYEGKILLHRLEYGEYGICGVCNDWFKSELSDCK